MKNLISFLACFIAVFFCNAQSTLTEIELQPFASGYNNPIGIYSAGDDRMFILEQNQSDIEIVDLNGNQIGTFLDLTGLTSTGGERGLLGLAFAPDYSTSGKFYVNYTNNSGNTVIAEYTVSGDPDVADFNSGVVLLTINQDFSNHNGGHIAFGPDGYLYVGMGDGGSGGDPMNRAQNPQSLLGKMLRIDVPGNGTYSIPSDNPFVGDPNTLDEIWSLGLRNPWKFSFDSETGDLWIGDVGQNAWEEIDFEPAGISGGLNYGWRCYEGTNNFAASECNGVSVVDPVAEYSHSNPSNFCSITGGIVYRGSTYENMQGHYFLTDYCDGSIFTLYPDGNGGFTETEISSAGNFGYVAFGEDVNGEMYLVDNGGSIFKVTDPCDDLTVSISVNGLEIVASASENVTYEWILNGNAIPNEAGNSISPTDAGTYWCIVTSDDGCLATSNSFFIAGQGLYIGGCTDPCDSNYNPNAHLDDGSCLLDGGCGGNGSDCPGDFNDDNMITASDLSGFLAVFGNSCE